ncbi:MAG: SDR family oxidoreductase [Alphaproteobacteria bacterium]|nr:SDR family oxidoreductase [Alphaproteobacteria bacterium]
MKLSLSGKVILVTGATQGVGEGVARAAVEAGCAGLVLTGRSAERGNALAKDLSKSCPAIFVAADLADPAATKRVVAEGAKTFPTIDGLVNAAGLTDRGTIFDTSVELWDLLYAVNVRAPFILTQEIATRLRDQKKPGSIVNVITMSSHGGQPFLTAYSSSKGALATLTKNTAHALRKNRIRVNGLNIGWMDTPGEHAIKAREGQPGNWLEIAEKSQPFGRLLKPRDAAVLAVYLLSDASELVTGSVIDVDQNVMGAYD